MDSTATGTRHPTIQSNIPAEPEQLESSDNADTSLSPLSFVKLMTLERLDGPTNNNNPSDGEDEKIERFRSLAVPYAPGAGVRAFGGHVYAQSAYAASKTVKSGFVIHVSS